MDMTLSWFEIGLRLALAVIAGIALGFDRRSREHSAGLRTTMLVCLAATVAMIQVNVLLATTADARSHAVTARHPIRRRLHRSGHHFKTRQQGRRRHDRGDLMVRDRDRALFRRGPIPTRAWLHGACPGRRHYFPNRRAFNPSVGVGGRSRRGSLAPPRPPWMRSCERPASSCSRAISCVTSQRRCQRLTSKCDILFAAYLSPRKFWIVLRPART
jgi:MgtC family